MLFHWLCNRYAQEQLKVFWEKGINNNADYFTKYHPHKHNQYRRPRFIIKVHIVRKLILKYSPIIKTQNMRGRVPGPIPSKGNLGHLVHLGHSGPIPAQGHSYLVDHSMTLCPRII